VACSPDDLAIRVNDVSPELTPNLKLRISNWVKRQLGHLLEDLDQQAAT
jgi:hypothetical protein